MVAQSKVRVCVLIDAWFPFVGGGQIHVRELTRALKKHGVESTIFHANNYHIIARALWCIGVIPQVITAHKHQPFQLIHAHAFAAGMPGKILSLLLKIPIVYTVHGSHLMDARKTGLKAQVEKWLLTKIPYTAEISVTKAFTRYPNANRNITTISNGVDIAAFDRVRAKKNANFTVLYVGRDHPTKGIALLRAAFTQIHQQHTDINLQLITDGTITGERLVHEYKKAHVFVLPSLAEGQPLVILEAWAAKLPVIASSLPGVMEVATHKDTLLVKPGDKAELTTAIISLYTMTTLRRQRMGDNGYRKVKQFYTWEKIAARTHHVYQALLR